MENSDILYKTAEATPLSAEESEKQQRKERRQKFLGKIRDSLGSVTHQLAFSPAEAAIACGKSPTWAYRKVYSGDFRVVSSDGRILIPRSEIERYLGGAEKYSPQPRQAKVGGGSL
jgi:helix-turn-helix protein